MYALEVETSLNCGRPSTIKCHPLLLTLLVCIRNQDIYIGNPSIFDDDVSLDHLLRVDKLDCVVLRHRHTISNATNSYQLSH